MSGILVNSLRKQLRELKQAVRQDMVSWENYKRIGDPYTLTKEVLEGKEDADGRTL